MRSVFRDNCELGLECDVARSSTRSEVFFSDRRSRKTAVIEGGAQTRLVARGESVYRIAVCD